MLPHDPVPPQIVVPPEPEPLIARRDLPEPLLVGSQGGVFNFRIYVCLTWTSKRLDKAAFETGIGRYTVDAQNQILECARGIAGDHSPHYVAKVQEKINECLPADFEPFPIGTDGGVLRCQARIRVAPDERLRARLAAHAEKLIDVENEHQLRVQRAKLMQSRPMSE